MIPFPRFSGTRYKEYYMCCAVSFTITKNLRSITVLINYKSTESNSCFSVSPFCSVKEIYPYKGWSGVLIQPSFMVPRVGGNVVFCQSRLLKGIVKSITLTLLF